jgi:hypothetical protein
MSREILRAEEALSMTGLAKLRKEHLILLPNPSHNSHPTLLHVAEKSIFNF